MRTLNKRKSNYELVYSTRDIKTDSRDGNAGDRPSRKSGGSRRGGAGAGNKNAYFGKERPSEERPSEAYTPADVLKKQQEIRKRGEDKKGEDYGNKR